MSENKLFKIFKPLNSLFCLELETGFIIIIFLRLIFGIIGLIATVPIIL